MRLFVVSVALTLLPGAGVAAPGDILFSDNFNDATLAPWTTTNAAISGILTGGATSGSNPRAGYTSNAAVTVTSPSFNAAVPAARLDIWIRRGSDAISEDTDPGENLVVEYLNNVATWVALETFNGAGGPGQTFVRSYNLPAAGRHVNFQLRIRMTDGDGAPFDFWHVDDVCFEQIIEPSPFISKVALTLTDPVNGGSNPKAIPGAVVQYTIDVANQGLGSPDSNSIVITDPLPAGTALFVDTSGGDPIVFIDGAVSSGLAYNYTTDVTFSNQVGGGPPYTYIPVPDGQGFDPAVTGYRINPTGAMNPTVGSNVPSFSIEFRVRIE